MTPRYLALPTEPAVYTVGYYDREGRWEPESDHATREEAEAVAAGMNGERLFQGVE